MSLILSGTDGVSDIDGTAATPAIRGTDTNTGIFFPAADTIAFAEGGAEVARMDSSGRLLIGTATSPNAGNVGQYARLFNAGNTTGANQAGIYAIARGEAATSITSGEDIGFLTFTDSAGNDFAYIQCQADANAGSGDYPSRLVFATTADGSSTVTERMRIDSSGNVGIGTTNPAQLLDLYSTDAAKARVRLTGTTNYVVNQLSNTSGDFYLGIDSSTANGFNQGNYSRVLWSNGAYPMVFSTNSAERMRIDSSGNVLIGTTTASGYSLGSVYNATTRNPGFVFQNSTTGQTDSDGLFVGIGMGGAGDASSAYFYHRENGSAIFATNNAERARITSSGVLSMTEDATKGPYIRGENSLSLASSATVTVSGTQAGGLIVIVYDNASGSGGLFWANYSSTVTKITGDGSATDAGSDIAVYKNAASHTTTVKNRYGDTRNFYIAVYSARGVR